MGKHYGQFSLDERCTIAHLHEAGRSIRQIAADLDRSPSSISRELKRNRGVQVGYKPSYAHDQARGRRWKGSRLDRDDELRDLVLKGLIGGWSPEQVSGRLKRQKIRISHETIYRFIYAQMLRTDDSKWRNYLPKAKYKRGRRPRPNRSPASFIKNRVSIELRPPAVQRRLTFGHWEADLMHFAQPGPTVLVTQERRSRVVLLARQPGRASLPVAEQLIEWFHGLDRRVCESITFDNGTEFAQHFLLTDQLGISTYFCDPHSPWQKGTVENTIGRLRRPLPRRTNINAITDDVLNACALAYNNTPRKCLGFQSPAEVFLKLLHFKCESTPSLRSG